MWRQSVAVTAYSQRAETLKKSEVITVVVLLFPVAKSFNVFTFVSGIMAQL